MTLHRLSPKLWRRIKEKVHTHEQHFMALLPYLQDWNLIPFLGMWKGLVLMDQEEIMEAVLVFRDALVFPMVFGHQSPCQEMTLQKIKEASKYIDNLSSGQITIIGPSPWVDSVIPSRSTGLWLDYQYLGPPEEYGVLDSGEDIRRLEKKDLELFMPLRELYEKEEVIPEGQKWSELQSRELFRKVLSTQIFFGILGDDIPLGLGGTNSLGLQFAQLGGIFIHREQRKKGHGTKLVLRICQELTSIGLSPLLYVKKTNLAALGLYEKLGFQKLWDFTIGYLG